jgi:hypothetical protein
MSFEVGAGDDVVLMQRVTANSDLAEKFLLAVGLGENFKLPQSHSFKFASNYISHFNTI